MQGGSPLTPELDELRANPSYLPLHHKMMHANWYKYIECTSMQVEMLNTTITLEIK